MTLLNEKRHARQIARHSALALRLQLVGRHPSGMLIPSAETPTFTLQMQRAERGTMESTKPIPVEDILARSESECLYMEDEQPWIGLVHVQPKRDVNPLGPGPKRRLCTCHSFSYRL